jgi:hypothetical protein
VPGPFDGDDAEPFVPEGDPVAGARQPSGAVADGQPMLDRPAATSPICDASPAVDVDVDVAVRTGRFRATWADRPAAPEGHGAAGCV